MFAVENRRWIHVLLTAAMVAIPAIAVSADETVDLGSTAAMESRLAEDTEHLASDQFQGRGVGTPGIDKAAEYIAQQLAKAGVDTTVIDGAPFQHFTIGGQTKLGSVNQLAWTGPSEKPIKLTLGHDFNPMGSSGSGLFDLPLAFVGYGITAEDKGYDDYAGIDVTGHAVIILRHEPQQDDAESIFNGKNISMHAPFARKVENAEEHGAAAVIFCTDQHAIDADMDKATERWLETLDELTDAHTQFRQVESPSVAEVLSHKKDIEKLTSREEMVYKRLQSAIDPVLPLGSAAMGMDQEFPVVHCRREVIDQVLQSGLGSDLATLEKQIDQGPTPRSGLLAPWRASGEIQLDHSQEKVRNVIGVLEGSGPLADETIVVGAHYDHLGLGDFGSFTPNSKEVHNGADDNASGTAALIEIARQLAAREQPLGRRVVFVAFSAEERGLLGSRHYVESPLFPLDGTVAMINLDMVGRLRNQKLTVTGTGTAEQFDSLLDRLAGQYELQLIKKRGGGGGSDHAPFYRKDVPGLHFFTGIHGDYHRATDDFDKVNVVGMRQVTQLATETVVQLANTEQRPTLVTGASGFMGAMVQKLASAFSSEQGKEKAAVRPFLGVVPDFSHKGPGLKIRDVAADGPAKEAGMQPGDVLLEFEEDAITGFSSLDQTLLRYKGGDQVRIKLRRGEKEKTLTVRLAEPR